MSRLALIVLLVFASVACSDSTAAPPQPVTPDAGVALTPRNFVCERFARNPKAKCEPEYTDAGDHHLHSARVTINDASIACGIDDTRLSVLCDELFFLPPQAAEAQKTPPKQGGKKK
jgi:hypothetical protein